MNVSLHPQAADDVDEAAAFYATEGSPALAARFISEFKRTAGLIATYPGIGSPRTRGLRGFGMRVFPFTVIYKLESDSDLRILVVKHDKRKPGFGSART